MAGRPEASAASRRPASVGAAAASDDRRRCPRAAPAPAAGARSETPAQLGQDAVAARVPSGKMTTAPPPARSPRPDRPRRPPPARTGMTPLLRRKRLHGARRAPPWPGTGRPAEGRSDPAGHEWRIGVAQVVDGHDERTVVGRPVRPAVACARRSEQEAEASQARKRDQRRRVSVRRLARSPRGHRPARPPLVSVRPGAHEVHTRRRRSARASVRR